MSYAPAQALASRLIGEKGGPVTFTRSVQSAYDPVTGAGGATVTTASSTAVAKKPGGADVERFKQLGTVDQVFRVLLVAAPALGSFAPKPNDAVAYGGESLTVRDVASLSPDGVSPILYDVVAGR
jgi:hypothetical protein